ncbi:hypothetical protein C8R46DRAFT_1036201 [Mycena filopes]|nr:hypothetical protein C8R46DRAFT_1036201 [Mycena filopes]
MGAAKMKAQLPTRFGFVAPKRCRGVMGGTRTVPYVAVAKRAGLKMPGTSTGDMVRMRRPRTMQDGTRGIHVVKSAAKRKVLNSAYLRAEAQLPTRFGSSLQKDAGGRGGHPYGALRRSRRARGAEVTGTSTGDTIRMCRPRTMQDGTRGIHAAMGAAKRKVLNSAYLRAEAQLPTRFGSSLQKDAGGRGGHPYGALRRSRRARGAEAQLPTRFGSSLQKDAGGRGGHPYGALRRSRQARGAEGGLAASRLPKSIINGWDVNWRHGSHVSASNDAGRYTGQSCREERCRNEGWLTCVRKPDCRRDSVRRSKRMQEVVGGTRTVRYVGVTERAGLKPDCRRGSLRWSRKMQDDTNGPARGVDAHGCGGRAVTERLWGITEWPGSGRDRGRQNGPAPDSGVAHENSELRRMMPKDPYGTYLVVVAAIGELPSAGKRSGWGGKTDPPPTPAWLVGIASGGGGRQWTRTRRRWPWMQRQCVTKGLEMVEVEAGDRVLANYKRTTIQASACQAGSTLTIRKTLSRNSEPLLVVGHARRDVPEDYLTGVLSLVDTSFAFRGESREMRAQMWGGREGGRREEGGGDLRVSENLPGTIAKPDEPVNPSADRED